MRRTARKLENFTARLGLVALLAIIPGCADGFLDVFSGPDSQEQLMKPAHAKDVFIVVPDGDYGVALSVGLEGDTDGLDVRAWCHVGDTLVYEQAVGVSGSGATLQPGPTSEWEAAGRADAECRAEVGAFHKNGRWRAADADDFVVFGEEDSSGSSCGDGTCDADEECGSCSEDCGACEPEPVCGDDTCDVDETCDNCASDCGACQTEPVCGDDTCDSGETCDNCASDCGACTTPQPAGIWIGPEELSSLPTSGTAWDNIESYANSDCGTPDLADQDDNTNVCIMATALAAARTGDPGYTQQVVDAVDTIARSGTYSGRALALGRELAAYVIAADLIRLSSLDPALDSAFGDKLLELRTTYADGGGVEDLVECHEVRPNNWGTHCGASRLAVALYLGRDDEVARIAAVFKGYLGDRSAYSEASTPGFKYGSDLTWQCDPANPVGLNPAGCMKDGHPIGGILPEEQRRCGSFQWPPCVSGYQWEGLQGVLALAWMLHRAGYEAFDWQDQAILRAFDFLHDVAGQVAEGDDEWQPYIVNAVYGTDFPTEPAARAGKNVGWTDWTHR